MTAHEGPSAPDPAQGNLPTAILLPLDQVDGALVEQLLDRAFEPGRHRRTAYRVRTGMDWLPGLSYAALDEDEYLVGTIQLWPIALTDAAGRAHPLLMVGPVAVLPERQGEGFGQALVLASLAGLTPRSGRGAALPQMLIGDAPYYGRFGFSAAHTAGWRLPGPWDPARLLARGDPAILPREGMLGPWPG